MPTPKFITDNTGKKLAVVLTIKEYRKLIEKLEDLEDIKAFDKVMKRKQEFIPLEDYKNNRKSKSNKL